MDGFTITHLAKPLNVEGIVTVHYFEFGKNYFFSGESHDFWELVYIDKGEAEVLADDVWSAVPEGNMVFHRPMQFHNLCANGIDAPNVAIVTFVCTSDEMQFFDNKQIKATDQEKELLAKIISLALKAFSTPLDDIFTNSLEKTGDKMSEQLLGIYLEELLASVYVRCAGQNKPNPPGLKTGSTAAQVVDYMASHINQALSVGEIAAGLMMSESQLKQIFKKETGFGVMTYFRNMKINHAKLLLRREEKNVTEIAQELGYDSIHHFSKQFKNMTGMSPREYVRSVKGKLDGEIFREP